MKRSPLAKDWGCTEMRQKPLKERNAALYQEWLKSKNYSELARMFGISKARCSQICKWEELMRSRPPRILSVRSIGVLSNLFYANGITIPDKAPDQWFIDKFRELLLEGRFTVKTMMLHFDNKKLRNCGPLSTEELLDKANDLLKRCPCCGQIVL